METDGSSILGSSKVGERKKLDKDRRASAAEKGLKRTKDKLSSLEMVIQERDGKICKLSDQLYEANERIKGLEREIGEMQSSVIWQLITWYQRGLVEPLLPQGTKRRRIYDTGIKECRVLLKGDWSALRHKTKAIEDKSPGMLDQVDAASDNGSAASAPQGVLSYPKFDDPLISIVLFASEKSELSLRCMSSVLANLDIPYALAVVSDHSDEEEFDLLDRLENVAVIKAEGITESVKACNHHLSSANGKYMLFLGPGVEISPGSVSAMVKTIEDHPRCAIVAGKLVHTNGKLDEAGGIAFYDGCLQSYGKGDDATLPDYSFLRQVDCCSGSFALVRSDLFKELGGLEELYAGEHYRFADLCFKAEKLGYKVVYQPNAVAAFHDTDLHKSLDKQNGADRSRFKSKWADKLAENKPFSHNALISRDRREYPRLLVIDDTVPAPYLGRGYPRASFMLKFLGGLSFKVTFLPLIDPTPWQPNTEQYQQMGIEVFCGQAADLARLSESRAGYYDLILVSRPHNMEKALPLIRRFFPCASLVYDAEALFSSREILKAEILGQKMSRSQAQDMVSCEIDLMRNSDAVITVSENEMRTVMKHGLENVSFWGHPVELMTADKEFDERKDILFVGAFADPGCPNEDAILYFVKEIFPAVHDALSCKLFVVGFNKLESIKNISSPSVVVTGYVDSLEPFYSSCRIFIVPHRFSTGIPWKLTEALGYGLPSVVSKLTAQQLNLVDGKEVLVAEKPEEFAQKIIKLYEDKDLWLEIQHNSEDYIKKNFDPAIMKEKLREILADLR